MKDQTLQTNIITLIRERKEEGLSLLYSHYSSALFGIIGRIISNTELAEEVLQSTFLKIWNNFDKFDESKSTIFTWIATVARNSAIDAVRLKKNQMGSKTEDIGLHVNNIAIGTNTHDTLDTNSLMKGLEDKYSSVLEYLYLRGYTQQEYSDEFNVPLGTVKTRLKQAINILRSNLGEEISLFTSIGGILLLIYILFH